MPDFVGDTTATTAAVAVGTPVAGTLETVGDHDWYRITLAPGQTVTISLVGVGATPLHDPYLRLHDSAGALIRENDDSGSGLDSALVFNSATGGTFYIDAGSYDDAYTGDFQVSVINYVPPPLPIYSNDQIADWLINGFWGGSDHHFNVTQGGTLTVNITGLNAEGQAFARAAFGMWSDIIGVTFSEVTTGGAIRIDDEDLDDAYADTVWDPATGITSSSVINIGRNWIAGDGTDLNTYSFQTYLHEIGHALGLGHGGDYNGGAVFPDDAHYLNDSWSTTVMSYFSQDDNSWFASQGFTYNFVMAPMAADIVSMSALYGLSTTTRTGNTIYGFGSTAGRAVFDAAVYAGAGYTVFDNGGVDTLNYSGYAANQLINLNAEMFSDVGGQVGNVVIARGTVIENATGGSGNDILVGNAANNVLNGGTGIDTANFGSATAAVTANLAVVAAQNTVGAGTDTLTAIENLVGSNFNDTLTGNTGANTLNGGIGNDTLRGGAGNDTLLGGEGNDTLDGGDGNDALNGGNGADLASYAAATAGVTVNLSLVAAQNTVGAGTDTLTSIESLTGSAFNDTLTGNTAANILVGGVGNDGITGGDGDDTIDGGAGNDAVNGGVGVDTASFSTATAGVTVNLALVAAQNTVGAGTDTLGAFENLTGSAFNDTLTGNTLANIIDAGAGNDSLAGGDGDDTLDGGAGNDTVNGGTGIDTANFASATAAVTVSLAIAGAQNTIGAGTDLLSAIENLTGSRFNDTLTGNTLANSINGGLGNDSLNGGDGNDTLDGGVGNDTINGGVGVDAASFASATSAVTVNLALVAAQNTVGAGTDTLAAIENLVGSNYNDTLTGNTGVNSIIGGSGNDSLAGGDGNDTLEGGVGNDLINGGVGIDAASFASATAGVTVNLALVAAQNTVGAGTDTLTAVENLTGSAFNDTLTGSSAANTILGGAGNDSLSGADGNDTLDGGAGNDTLNGGVGGDAASFASATAAVTVNLALAGAQNTVGAGTDTLTAIENLTGSAFNDTLTGNTGANVIDAGAGNDSLNGGDGIDTLDGGAGDDTINGSTGVDTASFASAAAAVTVNLATAGAQNTVGAGTDTLSAIENLTGSRFNDTLTGNVGVNVINGGLGNDSLNAGDGNDTLDGGAGDDVLNGGVGVDTASFATATAAVTVNLATVGVQNTVGAGSDTLSAVENLTGSNYNDTLTGNIAANTIFGGSGNDTIDGGAGNDTIEGGIGTDTLNGGTGTDRASYAAATAAVTVNLALVAAQNTVGAGTDTLSAVENLTGSNFNDTLTGSAGANSIIGGTGNDTIAGGGGNDSLAGSAGLDIFRFDTALNGATNVDTLSDFAAVDDTIRLVQTVFGGIGAGTLSAAAFRAGTAAADADDRIIYDSATGRIYYDADGNGAGAQTLFAKVAIGTAVGNTDFSVVASAADPGKTAIPVQEPLFAARPSILDIDAGQFAHGADYLLG